MKPLPIRIEAYDYHEFTDIQKHINLVDPTVKVREAGFNGKYVGIIYRGKLSDPVNAKLNRIIKAEQKEFFS
jgi:hypothetical protein